jgi:hypothetical protein
MTEHDPVRWTSSPDAAPDVLRDSLAACSREAPNDLQMKMLALKLAAISAGTAAAASATSTAKASAAGKAAAVGAAKGAGALTAAKIAASVALLGAVGTGALLWHAGHDAAVKRVDRAAEHAAPAENVAPAAEPSDVVAAADRSAAQAPVVDAPADQAAQEPSGTLPVQGAPSATAETQARAAEANQRAATQELAQQELPQQVQRARHAPLRARTLKPARETSHAQAKHTLAVETTRPDAPAVPSEVELLRRARASLGSRPREAFALTEQHRQLYPQGVFVQERDALAIEALMREGDMDMARDLARRFVRDYPSSPHAHRFRETMGL